MHSNQQRLEKIQGRVTSLSYPLRNET